MTVPSASARETKIVFSAGTIYTTIEAEGVEGDTYDKLLLALAKLVYTRLIPGMTGLRGNLGNTSGKIIKSYPAAGSTLKVTVKVVLTRDVEASDLLKCLEHALTETHQLMDIMAAPTRNTRSDIMKAAFNLFGNGRPDTTFPGFGLGHVGDATFMGERSSSYPGNIM